MKTLKALKAVLLEKINIEVMEETYRTLKPLEAIKFLMTKE